MAFPSTAGEAISFPFPFAFAMSAAIAFRGWTPEARPEIGVSMSIGSAIPGVCCYWALGDAERKVEILRIRVISKLAGAFVV